MFKRHAMIVVSSVAADCSQLGIARPQQSSLGGGATETKYVLDQAPVCQAIVANRLLFHHIYVSKY